MCRLKEVMDLRIRRSTINLNTKVSLRIFKENKTFLGEYIQQENDNIYYKMFSYFTYRASKPITQMPSCAAKSSLGAALLKTVLHTFCTFFSHFKISHMFCRFLKFSFSRTLCTFCTF